MCILFLSSPLSTFAACKARDTLAKNLYAYLFQSIVSYINQAFTYDHQNNQSASITLIDIAGFGKRILQLRYSLIDISYIWLYFSSLECFNTSSNRFEQLCINYTNEKIQNYCTQHLIHDEQIWYKSEGIDVPEILFPGNNVILSKYFKISQAEKKSINFFFSIIILFRYV